MRPPLDGTIVVTGASGGIGAALARELATTASTLVLVARRGDRLAELSEELRARRPALVVHPFACDLADRGELEALCDRIEREVGAIDVLVNNAGMGDQSFVESARWDRVAQLVDLNIVALTRLCMRFVPGMVARGKGGVLNVSSGFGLTYLPGFAAYAGSKHYVTAYTDTLRAELAGTGVVVTQVLPGPIATDFYANSQPTTPIAAPAFVELGAAKCAVQTLAGFRRGRALVVPGLVFWFVAWVSRMTPRIVLRAVTHVLARFQRPRATAGH
jgi:uncharacterized protein